MNPYMGLLVNPLVDILKTSKNAEDGSVLTMALEVLAKSISYDDGGSFALSHEITDRELTFILRVLAR